ncbi:1-phosphofructokinase family hexose kinase [Microbacterium sp. 3J1]|uniref:1-phosphofructokinase family hexose kinase n=1 Tax=Microbacterium sp. 3J1 TaxID=861269 RepID=UPI000A8C58F5|nr:hexose kinase [Microbacterium sp. 3J1]
MIVTLTVNPALDRTIALGAALRPGQVQAARSAREEAGGKGVNVSRVVAAAGVDTVAVLPLATDDPYALPLAATGIATVSVPVARQVRTNLALTDPEGVTTKVNLPGHPLTDADTAAVVEAVVEACADVEWLVLAGSLPESTAASLYVDVVGALRERWGARAPRIAVDASGPALREVVSHAAVDLIKPNDEELAELLGTVIDGEDPRSIVDAVRAIVPARVEAALVTLGGAGAALVTAQGAWVAAAPRIDVVSTVGAGDSSLAGYLLAAIAGADPAARLTSAIRYGAAAASLPGTQVPTPADLGHHEITVRSF